jgi:hypothetical protein
MVSALLEKVVLSFAQLKFAQILKLAEAAQVQWLELTIFRFAEVAQVRRLELTKL